MSLAALFSKGVSIIVGFLVARNFGSDKFGAYSFILSTVASLAAVSSLGLAPAITVTTASSSNTDLNLKYEFIFFARCIPFIFSILLLLISLNQFHYSLSKFNLSFSATLLAIIAFATIFQTSSTIEVAILSGLKRFRRVAIINIISGVILIIAILYALRVKNFSIVVLSILLPSAFNAFLLLSTKSSFSLSHFNLLRRKYHFSFIFRFLRTDFPYFLATLCYAPAIWLSTVVIINSKYGHQALSYFYFSDIIRSFLVFLAASAVQVYFPHFIEAWSAKNYTAYRSLLFQSFGTIIVLWILPSIPILLLSAPLLMSYHLTYDVGKLVLLITLATTFLTSLNTLLGQILLSQKLPWIAFVSNLIWAFFLFVFLLSLKSFMPIVYVLPVSFFFAYLFLSCFQSYYAFRFLLK